MNRHSIVWTAGNTNGVLMGPFALDGVKEWKHKYTIMVHNFGNFNLVYTPQYLNATTGLWTTCSRVGPTGAMGPYTCVARAEQTVEFMFCFGTSFRIWGRGVGGVTDGRIEMIEVDFESNISER